MTTYRFLEPLDVLFLRGNKLFGDPGSYGASLVPPWPSVVAGALRSHMLAAAGLDLNAFAEGRLDHPQLGTPEAPGSFTVKGFHLARRADDRVEPLLPLPADLVASRDESGTLRVQRLLPQPQSPDIDCSAPWARLPVLATDTRTKPESGLWLAPAGWQDYLAGRTPAADSLIESAHIWKLDARVGVGLDARKRRADDGKLFSVQAVTMVRRGQRLAFDEAQAGQNASVREPILSAHDIGFLAAIDGAEPPTSGTLRFGGDGRAVAIHGAEYTPPDPDYETITATGRCRLILTSPGLFVDGWRPTGCAADGRFELGGVVGQIVCAAVPRAEVVSGWDLAKWQPKPAQRVAPAGSVYWLEGLQAGPDVLRKLVERGLWGDTCENRVRRAEGFNRFVFATY